MEFSKEHLKALRPHAANFQLHVSLLMRVHNLPKPVAMGLAYQQGPAGLNALIAAPSAKPAQPEATK